MDPNTQLQQFRKEHLDIRYLVEHFGAALNLSPTIRTSNAEGLTEIERALAARARTLPSPTGRKATLHSIQRLVV
jgi:hypothetical protein